MHNLHIILLGTTYYPVKISEVVSHSHFNFINNNFYMYTKDSQHGPSNSDFSKFLKSLKIYLCIIMLPSQDSHHTLPYI